MSRPRTPVDKHGRVCVGCRVWKPWADYYPHPLGHNGRDPRCKTCVSEQQRSSVAIQAYQRRYREENRERIQARRREYRRRNAVAIRAKVKEWRKRNPEKLKRNATTWSGRRRTRLTQVQVDDIDRFAIYDRDGGRCHICKRRVSRERFHLDHLIPIVDGGAHIAENVAIAHPRCNLRRGAGRLPAQLRLLGDV